MLRINASVMHGEQSAFKCTSERVASRIDTSYPLHFRASNWNCRALKEAVPLTAAVRLKRSRAQP